ncbi:MAG: hypothetical protein AAGC71_12420 [Pseudomonadota bacterium]
MQFEPHRVVTQGLISKVSFPVSEIVAITIGRIPSLVDELGITIHAGNSYYFTDENDWFLDFTESLNIAQILGPNWYADAEAGVQMLIRRNDDGELVRQ